MTFSVLFGLVVGSFLNVIITRLPAGKSIVHPRSQCPQCFSPIVWYDNLPVLSFLFLRGKCRDCRRKIPIQYPVVELLTALLFLAVVQTKGFSWQIILRDWVVFSILISISMIDLKHRIIPDVLSYGGWAFCLITSFFVPDIGFQSSLIGGVVGFGLFFGFSWLYFQLTGRDGMGGGDIKLVGMLGAYLGASSLLTVIFFSSVAGSLVGGIYLLTQKKRGEGLKTAIPYGPFLVLGAFVYYFLGKVWLQYMIPI